MKSFVRWLNLQTKIRPFFSALVLLLLVVIPGYARVENATDKANKSANQVKTIFENERQQGLAGVFANCQTRNTATKHDRARFEAFFTGIETIFTNTPNQTEEQQVKVKEFVNNLRNAVPLDARAEDVDCNKDGFLDDKDYGL